MGGLSGVGEREGVYGLYVAPAGFLDIRQD